MNQLQDRLEIMKIKEHIEEKERTTKENQNNPMIQKLFIIRKRFFNVFLKIKKWFITRRTIVRDMLSRHSRPKITMRKSDTPKWYPSAMEIQEQKAKMKKSSHLVLIDMRYIYYTENEVVRLLLRLKKPSEICLVDAKYLNQKYTDLLFPYILLYGLRIIVDEKDVGKKMKSIFSSRQKEFQYVSIANSVNIREIQRYKIKAYIAPTREKKKKKPNKLLEPNTFLKTKWYPTFEEIENVRKEQEEKRNLILWDIENISYKEIDNIIKKVCTTGVIYCVSVQPLSQNVTNRLFAYILLYGIRVVVGHEDSDEKIKELIKSNYEQFKGITVISSDTDFVPIIKRVLDSNKKVHVISKDRQKKGMLMRLKIDHQDLSISTI